MIGIVMLYYFIFNYIPIIMGTVLSFKDMKVGNTIWNAKFVGWDNYVAGDAEPDQEHAGNQYHAFVLGLLAADFAGHLYF